MLALTLVAGIWAIVIGVMEIVTGIRLFGILVWINPTAGALSIAYSIGIWALIIGVLEIILGLRIRGLRDRVVAQAGV